MEGHEPPGTALPAPYTRTARPARTTLTRGGGEARTLREQERSHTQGTRGAEPKGNWTDPAERTDRMEWCTGRRREGAPGRDNPQHAPPGTRGGEEPQGRS